MLCKSILQIDVLGFHLPCLYDRPSYLLLEERSQLFTETKVLEYTGKEPTWKIGDLITASLPGALNPEVSMYMYTPLKDGYSTIVDTK